MLKNPNYVGDMATQKSSGGVLTPRLVRPSSEWVVVKGACPALVDRKVFLAAQRRFATQHGRLTDAEMLNLLRKLHVQSNGVTYRLIRATPWMPSPSTYQVRFGSLRAACQTAGLAYLRPPRVAKRWRDRGELARLLAELYQREGYLTAKLIAGEPDLPHPNTYMKAYGCLSNAYAAVGYVPDRRCGRISRVTQARREAARLRTLAAMGRPAAGAGPG